MVDSITSKAISNETATARITAATPVAATAPVATPAPPPPRTAVDIAQAGGLARSMAASAPVESDRVATIKKAISEGRFPILPATIADRMIALKLHWDPNDTVQHD